MNPLTQVKNLQKISRAEVDRGVSESASWHAKFKHSPYIFIGGLDYDLTEGDLLAVFAQYGEIVDVNLVRDKDTKKSRGFGFLAYYDQRSTNLAVDNLNGARISGRVARVDHVANYKKKKAEMESKEVSEDEEEENKDDGVGAPQRWPNGRYNQAAPGNTAAAAEGRRPAGGSQQAWEMPGSVFALLNKTSLPGKESTIVKTEGAAEGKKRKKEKDKGSKKKKKKTSNQPGDFSPAPSDSEDDVNGRRSPRQGRDPHTSKAPKPGSRPPAFGPPRPPKAPDARAPADDGTGHEQNRNGRNPDRDPDNRRDGNRGSRSERTERDRQFENRRAEGSKDFEHRGNGENGRGHDSDRYPRSGDGNRSHRGDYGNARGETGRSAQLAENRRDDFKGGERDGRVRREDMKNERGERAGRQQDGFGDRREAGRGEGHDRERLHNDRERNSGKSGSEHR